jgi:hypothetical protein
MPSVLLHSFFVLRFSFSVQSSPLGMDGEESKKAAKRVTDSGWH